jgi:hypothetical protein
VVEAETYHALCEEVASEFHRPFKPNTPILQIESSSLGFVVGFDQIATMKKIIKTWELVTVDGRRVFIGECGEATLESGSNKAFGVREIKGERPSNDQKRTAEEVSKRLGVECVWKPGSDSLEDHG